MVSGFGGKAWERLVARAQPLEREELRTLSPMMILVPHSDDETLGCGGLIAAMAALGLEVHIVYLTDGSASHTGSPAWPPERIAETRREEALCALSTLGIHRRDVTFLDWPDSAPLALENPAYEVDLATLTDWADGLSVKSIFAPWAGETHCDHVAANFLASAVAAAMSSPAARFEYLVWGWADSRLLEKIGGLAARCLDCSVSIALRRDALACHRTQMSDLIADAQTAFLIPSDLRALAERPAEIFLERPA